MTNLKVTKSPVELRLNDFGLIGEPIICQYRTVKDISSIFFDQEAANLLPPQTPVYSVQSWFPVPEGTPGGLFFGTSTIMPGKIRNEYFMTRGHFHALSDRAEIYWGVLGKGKLILMDRDRNTRAEEVYPGSLHYINSNIAHRLANTGDENLIVGACWPSDAGYDYEEIALNGFSARLMEIDGNPVLL
jgi:glucose-6-phosphate isomerase, archaeal